MQLPQSTTETLQVQNVEPSFGQGHAQITAPRAQGALRNPALTEVLAGSGLLCQFRHPNPSPRWGSSGSQDQKDLFLLSQNSTSLFFPSVLSKSGSQSLYQTLVSCRAGNAPTPETPENAARKVNYLATASPEKVQQAASLARHFQHPHNSSTSLPRAEFWL